MRLQIAKPHPGTGVFALCMQALEDSEDGLLVGLRHPNAVIGNRKYPMASRLAGGDFNHRRPVFFPVFHGVPQEVLENLRQVALTHPDVGHFGR